MTKSDSSSSKNGCGALLSGLCVLLVFIAFNQKDNNRTPRYDPPPPQGSPNGIRLDSDSKTPLISLNPAAHSITLRRGAVNNTASPYPSYSTVVNVRRSSGHFLLASFDLGTVRAGQSGPAFDMPEAISWPPPGWQASETASLTITLTAVGENGYSPSPAPAPVSYTYEFLVKDWLPMEKRAYVQPVKLGIVIGGSLLALLALFPAFRTWQSIDKRLDEISDWRPAGPWLAAAAVWGLLTALSFGLVFAAVPGGRAVTHLLTTFMVDAMGKSRLAHISSFALLGAVLFGGAALLQAYRIHSINPQSLPVHRRLGLILVFLGLLPVAFVLASGTQHIRQVYARSSDLKTCILVTPPPPPAAPKTPAAPPPASPFLPLPPPPLNAAAAGLPAAAAKAEPVKVLKAIPLPDSEQNPMPVSASGTAVPSPPLQPTKQAPGETANVPAPRPANTADPAKTPQVRRAVKVPD